MARNITEREGLENARPILRIMGIDLTAGEESLQIIEEPEM
jgi:hypothetical protein